jgi:predicted enzyme related to lactoylglutathione lyase
MANQIKLVVYPAKDLDKSKLFFSTFLGTEPYVDGDWYVGYKAGDLELGLDPHGKAVICYTDTDDIEASLETMKDAGGTVVMEPKNVGGGLMVAQVELDGNVVGLRQHPQK